ncbi:hypothetical protein BC937DRAFT_89679 [Endogone sp. FLAS-F59071]|nr:hypothetical protein BC937DRAFT_89679 [Endogone sp. FLAS-F59071]RUS17647.1 hypothetical protein BC937DRAFT_89679 [Endogone sp. FLAS-F59071]|eukprot:RUS17646.1 hypothetical protein BC937DRAFT_89679 [Endogone sp. FLAS-F59071]
MYEGKTMVRFVIKAWYICRSNSYRMLLNPSQSHHLIRRNFVENSCSACGLCESWSPIGCSRGNAWYWNPNRSMTMRSRALRIVFS